MAPLEGKTANTPRLGPVSTSRQRIAELARQAVGMAVAIAWLPGPAGTRRRVAKLSVEEPDAAEPARPDLWGARVSNDPGLPDRLSATLMNAPLAPAKRPCPPLCAQRLSATLMNAPLISARPQPQDSCAQRLSATLMNARSWSTRSCPCATCSTPFGDIDECTPAERNRISEGEDVLCSTPFGDIDECTVIRVIGCRLASVLNAFRRH